MKVINSLDRFKKRIFKQKSQKKVYFQFKFIWELYLTKSSKIWLQTPSLSPKLSPKQRCLCKIECHNLLTKKTLQESGKILRKGTKILQSSKTSLVKNLRFIAGIQLQKDAQIDMKRSIRVQNRKILTKFSFPMSKLKKGEHRRSNLSSQPLLWEDDNTQKAQKI